MSLSKMPIIFVENVICFGGKCSRLTFYDGIKCLSLVRYYLWQLNKKPLKLLTFVTASVHRKYKICIFYGISICDKPSSIVNIKEGIIYDDRRNIVGTINTCDGLRASKIQYIYIFFYGVIICDKHDSIVSIKKGISDRHEAIENGKIFWRENAPLLFTFVTTFVHCN